MYGRVHSYYNFTGYTYDETLDLYFAQNRFYDAENHRFTQEDVVKDGANWYVYCGNNALIFVDFLGCIPTPMEAAEMAKQMYTDIKADSRIGLRKISGGWRLIDIWKGSEGLKIGIYVRGDGKASSYTGAKEYAFVNKGSSTGGDWANNFQQPWLRQGL